MIIISTLILMLFATPQPETIPPLPIEELKKIELHYNDTLLKPFPVDTLFLRFYGWNIYGTNIVFSHPIGKKTVFNFDADAGKNQDYSEYFFSKGNIDIGWLTGNFWQELGVSAFWKKRTQEYYRQVGLSYTPIWFISSATLMLDNTIRGAQYFNNTQENFINGKSELSYNAPSPIGIIDANINTLLQNYNNNGPTTLTSTSVGLGDLITFGDNFYIKPSTSYNIEKKNLSVQGNIGFLLYGFITNIDIENNNVNTFYFDTLYANVLPIIINRDLDYPICDWNIGLSIQRKNLIFSARYRQFSSFIDWFPMIDTIIPIYDRNYKDISTTIKVTWSPIINIFTLSYAPDKRNLIPLYTLADSLQINLSNFTFGTSCLAIGQRRIETMFYGYYIYQPYYMIYSSSIAYQWRYLKLFASVDNILNNKYEIIPYHSDLGRKYYIGLEIIPERKK